MADTLQQWADYIDEYEAKMVEVRQRTETILNDPQSTAQEKKDALDEQYRQEIHLKELKAQYAVYSISGVVPETVTFGGASTTSPVLVYKTNDPDDTSIHHGTVRNVGGSGDLSRPNSEIPLGTLFQSDLINVTIKAYESQGYSQSFLSDITINNFRAEEVSGGYWWKIDANRSLPYSIVNRFSVSGLTGTSISDDSWSNTTTRTVLQSVWGDLTNVRTINRNSSYTVSTFILTLLSMLTNPAGTVPGDSPWDYYNDTLRPRVPNNPAFPEGYHPEDPHEPVEEPELPETDEGEPPATQNTRIITSPSWFITQYILSNALLESLGKTLWSSWLDSNSNVWENFLFDYFQQTGTFNITAALDYIISLRVYPFDLHAIINPTPPEGFYGQSDGVYMGTGKTNFTYSSGINTVMTINSVSGFLDMGECEVGTEYPYNDFRDIYNTTIMCYLPYCGMVELNPADVWGKTLKCHYFIDFQSGGCTAIIKCPTGNGVTTFPVASKSGQIGFTLPLTSTNAGQLAAQFIGDATRAVGTIAGMGFDIGRNVSSYLQGNMNTADMAMGIGQSTVGAGLSLANQAVNILSRPGVNMPMLSGGSGCESLMMYPSPFITIRRGRYAKPENYGHSEGYAITTSGRIGDYKGMNCFTGVDASGLSCHADERDAIVKLLENGVYLPVD